ncbi:MAG: hypothetical protein ACREMO_11125 [Gemmatimonadales bacterium]
MTERKILGTEESKPSGRARQPMEPAPEVGWELLAGLGLMFTVVSLGDIVLAWLPPQFASPEWRFATVTASLNTLPLLSMGLLLLFGGAVARGNRGLARALVVVIALVAFAIIVAGLFYASTLSIAFEKVTDPVIRFGLKRSVFKTASQLVLYPPVFLWVAATGWRHCSPPPTPEPGGTA